MWYTQYVYNLALYIERRQEAISRLLDSIQYIVVDILQYIYGIYWSSSVNSILCQSRQYKGNKKPNHFLPNKAYFTVHLFRSWSPNGGYSDPLTTYIENSMVLNDIQYPGGAREE